MADIPVTPPTGLHAAAQAHVDSTNLMATVLLVLGGIATGGEELMNLFPSLGTSKYGPIIALVITIAGALMKVLNTQNAVKNADSHAQLQIASFQADSDKKDAA